MEMSFWWDFHQMFSLKFFSTFGGACDENVIKNLLLWKTSKVASDKNFVKQMNIVISVLVYIHDLID